MVYRWKTISKQEKTAEIQKKKFSSFYFQFLKKKFYFKFKQSSFHQWATVIHFMKEKERKLHNLVFNRKTSIFYHSIMNRAVTQWKKCHLYKSHLYETLSKKLMKPLNLHHSMLKLLFWKKWKLISFQFMEKKTSYYKKCYKIIVMKTLEKKLMKCFHHWLYLASNHSISRLSLAPLMAKKDASLRKEKNKINSSVSSPLAAQPKQQQQQLTNYFFRLSSFHSQFQFLHQIQTIISEVHSSYEKMFLNYNAKSLIIQYMTLFNDLLDRHYERTTPTADLSHRFICELYLFNQKDGVFYGLSSKYFEKDSAYYIPPTDIDEKNKLLLEKFDYYLSLEGILGKCYEMKKTIVYYYSENSNNNNTKPEKKNKTVRYLLIPLISQKTNEIIGILQLINKKPLENRSIKTNDSSMNVFLNHFNINSYEFYFTNIQQTQSTNYFKKFISSMDNTTSSFHHLNNSLMDLFTVFLNFQIPIYENLYFFILLENVMELYSKYYVANQYTVQNFSYHQSMNTSKDGNEFEVGGSRDEEEEEEDKQKHSRVLSKISLITSPTKRKEMIEKTALQHEKKLLLKNYYQMNEIYQQQTILQLLKSSEDLLLSFPSIMEEITHLITEEKLQRENEKRNYSLHDKEIDNELLLLSSSVSSSPARKTESKSSKRELSESLLSNTTTASSRPVYPFSKRSAAQKNEEKELLNSSRAAASQNKTNNKLIKEEISLLDRINSKLGGSKDKHYQRQEEEAEMETKRKKFQRLDTDDSSEAPPPPPPSSSNIDLDITEDFEMTPELQKLIQDILSTHQQNTQQLSPRATTGGAAAPSKGFNKQEIDSLEEKYSPAGLNDNYSTISPIGIKLNFFSMQEQLLKSEKNSFILMNEIVSLQKVIKYFKKYHKFSFTFYEKLKLEKEDLKEENISLAQDKEQLMKAQKDYIKKIR
jgi:hypothetical protein